MTKRRSMKLAALAPLDVSISYVDIYRDDPANQNDSHVHPECEIYVNLSGDVSFMVEKNIYEIKPGDIIITRPYEYHHCIYNSDKLHRHFWMLFTPGGNEELFKAFFKRPVGEGNLLSVPDDKREAFISLCEKMTEQPLSECEKYAAFFRLISYIEKAKTPSRSSSGRDDEISFVLDFISEHFRENISISELAAVGNVSVNTLERHFRESLGMSPSAYIKNKRLANAAELLFSGKSVSEACEQSGFSDYSHFIAVFRKNYGITPLKYKKYISKKQ